MLACAPRWPLTPKACPAHTSRIDPRVLKIPGTRIQSPPGPCSARLSSGLALSPLAYSARQMHSDRASVNHSEAEKSYIDFHGHAWEIRGFSVI